MDNFRHEKLIHAATYFLKKTKYCGKTKLCKLLYYLDFMHFRETGRSVTGLVYQAWKFGPFPPDFGNSLDTSSTTGFPLMAVKSETGFTEIKSKVVFDSDWFSAREMSLLTKVAEIFQEAKTEHIVEASHLPNHPWDKTRKEKGDLAEIDYLLALDSSTNSISLEEALEQIMDRKALHGLLIKS
jgi:uncharacterized phage-associated protein